ncbi:resolvase, N terminal domain protein [Brucella pseudogrignonensis]|uniref:Resolvase, N terminal domain protein n=1 Tax=Brucella pseudogrignonensis TaxID=419475 RepID=A0A256G6X1_9HYPH|nr:resolvase, N terminal domain protein [Brucella pseudogrignonensis]
MPRTLAFVRVSTTGQTTQNQIQDIKAVGFQVEPRRIVNETVSGSTPIARRRGFSKLMGCLEAGDVLIVTKLGRDAIDVSTTVKALSEMGESLLSRSWWRGPHQFLWHSDYAGAQCLCAVRAGFAD